MYKLITAPTTEILTVGEAKTHLRVSSTSEDVYINSLIRAATRAIENYINGALITQTWEKVFDRLDTSKRYIDLGKGPIQSITSFKYYDGGILNTWGTSNYFLDDYSSNPRIGLNEDITYPDLDHRINAVVIQFVAGYGDRAGDIPDDIREACKLMVAYFYENRDDKIQRSPFRTGALPVVITYLLNPYRLWVF